MRTAKSKKQQESFDIYAGLVGYVGGGAIIAALWYHSLMPIIIATAGLFVTLAFFNGLG